jgi:hypothetical protein
MSRILITFEHACEIVQKSLACIVDGNALSYAVINEDSDGNDCIEVNWHDDDGLNENTFGKDDKYFISDDGCLIIHPKKMKVSYSLQFLKIVKVH